MYLTSKIDYRFWQKKYVVFGVLFVTVLLLFSVFGFPAINGARRWIRMPGFSFQPSELAKIALPIFLAWFLTKNEETIGSLRETVLPCLAVLAFLGGSDYRRTRSRHDDCFMRDFRGGLFCRRSADSAFCGGRRGAFVDRNLRAGFCAVAD